MLKNSIKTITLIALFILFISCFDTVYGYNIKFEAKALENFDGDNGLTDIFYRIYEPPAQTTITWYNRSNKRNGWAYTADSNYNKNQTVLVPNGSGGYNLPGGGTDYKTYRQWSTIFHPQQNTDFGSGTALSYVTYTSSSEAIQASINKNEYYVPTATVGYTNINGETYGYRGLYDAPFVDGNTGSLYSGYNENVSGRKNGVYEILNTDESLLRSRIENNTLISDRQITKEQVANLYDMFGDVLAQDRNGDGIRDEYIYVSAVNYSDHRDKATTRTMDTAYKFYRYKSAIVSSGKSSVINTYDNILILPKVSKTQVYIRHIDVTDIIFGREELTSDSIDNLAARSATVSALSRVGYVTKTDSSMGNSDKINYTSQSRDAQNAETYIFDSTELKPGDYYRTYSKTGTDYELVGTVVGIGNIESEAVANRTQKYNAMASVNELTDTYRDIVDILKQDTEKYIVIDYLYSRNEPVVGSQEKPILLVRHLNVSGIGKVSSSSQINSIIDNGERHVDYFLGYGKIYNKNKNQNITYEEQGHCYYYIPALTMNESYRLNNTGTYRIYNNFYGQGQTDTNYLGYIITRSNSSPAEAVKKRNDKILNINFNNLNTLDGVSGNGYMEFSNDNSSPYIMVDMYYRSKSANIITPDVRGRLSFNSANSIFTDNTDGYYDHIPGGETMYADITGANKFMLGGIKVVPKTIENNQLVTITVNVPYSYSYNYWSSSSCSNGHYGGNPGASCSVVIPKTCTDPVTGESSDCSYTCGKTISKNYSTISGSNTIAKTFNYKVPYKYQYYKVSNIRTYKITHMELYDTDNQEDLRLFEGKIYNIPVTQAYKDSVKGSFVQSTSKQTLTDSRSISRLGAKENKDEKGTKFTETVTIPTLSYSGTYQDTIYTDTTATNKFNNTLLTVISKINSELTHDTATRVTSISKEGKVNTTSQSNVEIKFEVANDKISAGNVNILVNKSKDYNYKNIKLTGSYKDTVTGTKVEVSTDRPDNIYKQYGFSDDVSNPTNTGDFSNESLSNELLKIPELSLNGERKSKAKIYYELVADEDTSKPSLNFDVADTTSPHAWTRTSATANGSTFVDIDMNKDKITKEEQETTIKPGSNLRKQITYDYTSSRTSPAHGTGDVVNVFTPIKFGVSLTNVQARNASEIVNHSTDKNISKDSAVIQKDTRFKITISPQGGHAIYPYITSTKMDEYIKQYYIKFDNLDIQDVKYKDSDGTEKTYNNGSVIVSGQWIGPIPNIGADTYITAITRDDPNVSGGIFKEGANSYTVRGVTKNATSLMLYDLASNTYSSSLIDSKKSSVSENTSRGSFVSSQALYHNKYYTKKQLYNDANFVSQTTEVITQNLGRIYDFKVTDVKDLDWKDTFRKSTSSNTNVHSGIVYYSGTNKLNIYTTAFNDIIRRNSDEIGASAEKTLPIGPYKNTNTGYTYAPKLGYRFSFDFKSTGKIVDGKTANIDVSFMFIDKDDGDIHGDIDLYYKNSSGKYVKIGTTSDNMKLYFVPNDGYRLTFDEGTYNFSYANLTSSTVELGTLTKLSLNSSMMATSDNSFAQIWYGEYKLPNSTIAVMRGERDLDTNRLKNGYIAVKFDISVADDEDTIIKYGQNNRDSAGNEIANTSQWDMEGYLGYSGSNGAAASNLKLRFDDGRIISIDDEAYNKLKGTVMLYDADARAASDYN